MHISVLITCYNLEKYISLAIRSALDQDYDRHKYEIIVVDDCSSDCSAEIIKSYDSVKYVRTDNNKGVLCATILGMQHATGEIIAFLDGDDIWRNDKLSNIATKFNYDNSLIFLTHNYRFINDEGDYITGTEYTQNVYSEVTEDAEISKLIREGILHRKNYVWLGSAYSIKLKKEDINAFMSWINKLPNPQLTYQDWPLAFWIAASCEGRFGYDNEQLFFYRIHTANYSGDSNSLQKAIGNWSKAYNTSACLLEIANKFSCEESVKTVCRMAVESDEIVLSLFQKQKRFFIFHYITKWRSFGSFGNWIKEVLRMLAIKIFGFRFYFFLKKRIALYNK